MSRIGKLPISIPQGVKIQLGENRITVNGPKGALTFDHHELVSLSQAEGKIIVSRKDDTRRSSSIQGLTRTLIANMITGVTAGYKRELEVIGVGYRAEVKGKNLTLIVGFAGPVEIPLPPGIDAAVEKNTKITLTGIDKQKVGQFAAQVRKVRPPEPYKGKGIKYIEEVIRRKVGKTSG